MTTRNTIAEYIKKADYPALVSEANKNQAKVLKYVQSYIYGDYDDPIRWQAISAFGHLAHEYAEMYRRTLPQCPAPLFMGDERRKRQCPLERTGGHGSHHQSRAEI